MGIAGRMKLMDIESPELTMIWTYDLHWSLVKVDHIIWLKGYVITRQTLKLDYLPWGFSSGIGRLWGFWEK